jgi:hypothetical protein
MRSFFVLSGFRLPEVTAGVPAAHLRDEGVSYSG